MDGFKHVSIMCGLSEGNFGQISIVINSHLTLIFVFLELGVGIRTIHFFYFFIFFWNGMKSSPYEVKLLLSYASATKILLSIPMYK